VRQDGSVVRTYADSPQAATDGKIVVEVASGKLTSGTRSITVPRSAHLVGTRHGFAAVTYGRTTLLVRLRDGRKRTYAGSVAALSDVGLYTAIGTRLNFTRAAPSASERRRSGAAVLRRGGLRPVLRRVAAAAEELVGQHRGADTDPRRH
jgi:hypothetical protein